MGFVKALVVGCCLVAIAALVMIVSDPSAVGPYLTLAAMVLTGTACVLTLRGRSD